MLNIKDLEKRYIELYGKEPCSEMALKEIEDKLDIELPSDFKEIACFYSGGLLGGVSHHEIASAGCATNILNETMRLRESIRLDNHFVVLAEPSESIIVLNVSEVPAVIWCDAVDAININSASYNNQPDTWESYSEFFSYLLSEEEDE